MTFPQFPSLHLHCGGRAVLCCLHRGRAGQIPFQAHHPGGAAGGCVNYAIARVVAKLGEQLGQSVIVENRPGAGGTLATGTTAQRRLHPAADGRQRPCDWPRAVQLAALIREYFNRGPGGHSGLCSAAHPSFPANTVAEMVALAKASPGKDSIAGTGR